MLVYQRVCIMHVYATSIARRLGMPCHWRFLGSAACAPRPRRSVDGVDEVATTLLAFRVMPHCFMGFKNILCIYIIYIYIYILYIYGLNLVSSNTPWFTPWFIVRNPWSTLPWFPWLQVLWSPRGSPQGIWGATWELRVPCRSRGGPIGWILNRRHVNLIYSDIILIYVDLIWFDW